MHSAHSQSPNLCHQVCKYKKKKRSKKNNKGGGEEGGGKWGYNASVQ